MNDEELYQAVYPRLMAYAVGSFDLPPADAEDVVHDAVCSYLSKKGVLKPRAYLFAAVSNGCRTYWRRRLRMELVPLGEALLRTVEPPPYVARLTTQAALRKLGRRDQQVLTLRYHHGCTVREIGLTIGVSHSRAEKLLRRALERAALAAASEDVANRSPKGRRLEWTDTYLTLEYRPRRRCKEPRWTTASSSRRSASRSTTRWRRGSTSISRTSFIRPASSWWTSAASCPGART